MKEESGESHRFDIGDRTSFENHRADTSPLSNLSLKVQGENTLLLPLCDQINVFVQWIMVTEDDHSAATRPPNLNRNVKVVYVIIPLHTFIG